MNVKIKKTLIISSALLLFGFGLFYFTEEVRDEMQYIKNKKNIKMYENTHPSSNRKSSNDLQDYVLINKSCVNCINERKGNAGCLTVKDNKILLVRYRRTNKINAPGGFRDYLHKDTFIASEEMRNALGYVVSIEDFVNDFHPMVGISRDINFRLYKCKIIKKTKKTNDKILEEFWVDKQGLYNLLNGKNSEADFSDELQFIYDKFEFLTR